MKSISSVADYISKVTKIIAENNDDKKIVVFRGETQDFGDTSCVPNIFRKRLLENNKRFEKNLFDEMTANNVSIGSTYLEKAISAQHDGFPSRLLDVTYNSLVALYFACTPYYHEVETSKDEYDGKVFLFFIEKMFCPVGENIVSNYDEIIKSDTSSFISKSLFNSNHKLIDHIKTNKRIIAQQGAFILFQGNDYKKIPERISRSINIPKEVKPKLRKELKDLFGIYTGSVYPQPENFVKDLEKKSSLIDATEFSFETELNMALYNLEEELKYQIDIIYSKNTKKEVITKIIEIEKYIKEFKLCIQEIKEFCLNLKDENNYKDSFSNFLHDYNIIVKEFSVEISECCEDSAEDLYKNYEIKI
ncbi:MAG: FRG domain-containing protein [Clostridia bacterium]|nr:FRG domain-containing protein [Clostridia bacterium]